MTTRVLELLRRYGDSSTGFQTLEPGFSYAFLHEVITSVTAFDAVLTIAQAVSWNLPRMHGVALTIDSVALGIGVAAPLAATAFLWTVTRGEVAS